VSRRPRSFATYFDVADEIYDTLVRRQDQARPMVDLLNDSRPLADLEPRFVNAAQQWANATRRSVASVRAVDRGVRPLDHPDAASR
jgi:hypothetical protein